MVAAFITVITEQTDRRSGETPTNYSVSRRATIQNKQPGEKVVNYLICLKSTFLADKKKSTFLISVHPYRGAIRTC